MFAGALLFVSHDRAFVRRLATRIVELDRGQLRELARRLRRLRAAEARRARCRGQARGAVRQEARAGGGVDPPGRGGAAHPQRGPGARAQAAADRAPRAARAHSARSRCRPQDAAPSGKLVFEARDVALRLRRARRSSRISPRASCAAIASASSGRTAAARRTLIKLLVGELEPHRRLHLPRHVAAAGLLRSAARAAGSGGTPSWTTSPAAAATRSTIDGRARHVSGYLRDFLFPPERLHRAGQRCSRAASATG